MIGSRNALCSGVMRSAEFVDVQNLEPGALIDVETKNRHYQIEYLGGNAMKISGHPEICPDPVEGTLQGSADKSGVLEPGLIGRGLYMRFLLSDRPVTTSRILSVHVDPSGSSIH